jgi:hypothetical protein
MEARLSKCCDAEKVNKVTEFRKWLSEVKHVDEMLWAEHKEFEAIAKSTCNASCHNNVLSEPSHHFNNLTSSSNANTAASSKQPCLKACPKLTDGEHRLLYDNDGCLKCRHFSCPTILQTAPMISPILQLTKL